MMLLLMASWLMVLLAPCLVLGGNIAYRGADISSLLKLEAKGISYSYIKPGSNPPTTITAPLEKILADAGVNMVRQRLFVDPGDGFYNQAYNLRLSKRASAAGHQLYLDLHLSDSWADPSKQFPPAAWDHSTIEKLTAAVYSYTMQVSNAYADAGLSPTIMSIGNEIATGLLFPLGKVPSYHNIASILHSASAGIKDSKLSKKPQIMIHLQDAWNTDQQVAWYRSVLAQGPLTLGDFDMMGVSFYPFYNSLATIGNLKRTLTSLAGNFGKKTFIAETNWPASCPSPGKPFPSDSTSIPKSEAGQVEWINRIAHAVLEVEGAVGFAYWELGWIGNANLGSSCADNLLVDQHGTARPGIAALGSAPTK